MLGEHQIRHLFSATLCFLVWSVLFPGQVTAQQTVGLFKYEEEAESGYTLFRRNTTVYLIDNCGFVVHSWVGSYPSGGAVYLLENGDLLRVGKISSELSWAPQGGVIERQAWDGEILWQYFYATDSTHQHHDIEPLPNGNVLLLAWEWISADTALAWGRDPDSLSTAGMLFEGVVEIAPDGPANGTVVWEWHMNDHLIQDHDSSAKYFGAVSQHPGRINLNYNSYDGNWHPDWVHANAVSYHADRDEIAISARQFNEVWIIDHSTTTSESRGGMGGRHGKGGDLIYRWGNPQAFDQGSMQDRILYGQHDVRFTEDGDIMLFNNGADRPGPRCF